MRIDVTGIESHIDQGSAAGEYCDRLEDNDLKSVIKEIAMYAIMLVEGPMDVNAECDETNLPLDHDTPPVMPQHLVRLRPSKFIQDVLNVYRDRLEKFWAPEPVEKIEENHRDLIKMYRGDDAVRNAIDKHDVNTLFNDAWDCVPRFKRLRGFCGGLSTIFWNTTSVESNSRSFEPKPIY